MGLPIPAPTAIFWTRMDLQPWTIRTRAYSPEPTGHLPSPTSWASMTVALSWANSSIPTSIHTASFSPTDRFRRSISPALQVRSPSDSTTKLSSWADTWILNLWNMATSRRRIVSRPSISQAQRGPFLNKIIRAASLLASLQTAPGILTAFRSEHGYIQEKNRFTTVDFPGATGTILEQNNSRGLIVGEFTDSAGNTHSFLLRPNHGGGIGPGDSSSIGCQSLAQSNAAPLQPATPLSCHTVGAKGTIICSRP